jgi:hypothetical protein
MSALAVGGHIPILGPAPRERAHSLLTVPGVLVATDELEPYWKSGIAVLGYPDEVPALWEGCSAGTFRTKSEGSTPPQAVFTSFVLYVPISCSALGVGNFEEFTERGAAVLRATQAYGMELALAQGVTGIDNPYLGDANLDILAAGAAVSAGVALSYLDEYIAASGRQGLIHITPAVANALSAIPVGDDDPVGPVYSVAGTPIAIGAGYADTIPDGEAAPAATEDWIFATGPVEVRIEDTVDSPESITEALERSLNDVTVIAEKVAVVSWDAHLQGGVLVDWAL